MNQKSCFLIFKNEMLEKLQFELKSHVLVVQPLAI